MRNTEKFYTVEAAHSQQQVEDGQCDIVDRYDTLKEAKARARYLLTDAAQASFEMSEPLRYARVLLNGKLDRGCCVADYFRNERTSISDVQYDRLGAHDPTPHVL